MIEKLFEALAEFPGQNNRVQCFLHILNLVAKTILKPFDLPKAKDGSTLTQAALELQTLAGDMENSDADDDLEGLVDDGHMEVPSHEMVMSEEDIQPM
jgi:hypothetical protein